MSVVSGLAGASAAGKAADAQADAAAAAAAVQKEMFDISREDLTPWREAGKFGLSKLVGSPVYSKTKTERKLVGGGPGSGGLGYTKHQQFPGAYLVPDVDLIQAGYRPEDYPGYQTNFGGEESFSGTNNQIPPGYRLMNEQNIKQMKLPGVERYETVTTGGDITGYEGGLLTEGPGEFEESPDYLVRLKRGLNALMTKGAALGRTGGGLEKDIIDYAQDSATLSYDNWLNNYYKKLNPFFSLAGLGQVATSQGGNQAMTLGSQLGQNALVAGGSRASGYINQANAYSGASNSIVQALPHLKSLWGGGGSTGGGVGSYMNAATTYGGGSTGDWYS